MDAKECSTTEEDMFNRKMIDQDGESTTEEYVRSGESTTEEYVRSVTEEHVSESTCSTILVTSTDVSMAKNQKRLIRLFKQHNPDFVE